VKRFRKELFVALITFLVSGSSVAWALDYSVQSLEVGSRDMCVPLSGDFDGDGRTDLLLWDGKALRLFLMESDDRLALDGRDVALAEDVCLFDSGDLDGNGRDDLVFLTGTGILVSRFDGDGFAPAARWMDAVCDLGEGTVGPLDLVMDVNGDGLDDVWTISGDSLAVCTESPSGEKIVLWKYPIVTAENPVEPEGLPYRIHRLDLDGDSVEDLLSVTPNGLTAFRLESGPSGCDVSTMWQIPFAPYLDEDDAREIVDENLSDVTLFEDVTGDGRKEFFLSSWSRGRVFLFRSAESFFEREPSQVFDVGAVVTGISVVHTDGHDLPSLLIHRFEPPSIPGALFRVVTRRKIKVKFHFLLYEPAHSAPGLYPDRPTASRLISVEGKRGDEKKIEPRFVVGDADFNGDGWNDLAVLAGASSLEFHWAREPDTFDGDEGVPPLFAEDEPPTMSLAEFSTWTHDLMVEYLHLGNPNLTIRIPSPRGFMIRHRYTEDLNGDGIADLMLPHCPMDDEASCRLVVLLSRE